MPRAIVAFLIVLVMAIVGAGFLDYALPLARPARAEELEKAATGPRAENARGVPDYTKITGFHEVARLPVKQPVVLWQAFSESINPAGNARASALTDPVVADGVVYFGDDSGTLVALGTEDGREVWTYAHGSRIAQTPSVDKDHVYFGSQTGITALQRETGDVDWHCAIPLGAGEATPLPVGNRVFFSAYDGCSYCLNQKTGEQIWKHDFAADAPPDQPGFAGAQARFQNIVARPNGAACDGKLFIQSVFDQSRVIALDCETGKRHWSFQTGGWIRPAPTISGDRVYVVSQDKHVYCLNRDTGALIWKFNTPSWLSSRVAVHDGRVFLAHHGAKLYQLEADSGKLIRMFEPPDEEDREGLVYSFPIIANQTAYFASGKGVLLAVDVETGKLRWRLRPSEKSELFTEPATDGRRIFVTCRAGNANGGEHSVIAIGGNE